MADEGRFSDAQSLWGPHLDETEKLVWTGRPSAVISIPFDSRFLDFVGGCFAVALGIVIIAGKLPQSDENTTPALFGWFIVAIGAASAIAPLLWSNWQRWNSRYAVTTRRALILRRSFGFRSMQSWQVQTIPALELATGWHKSVWFDKSKAGFLSAKRQRNIGFEMISDAEEVFSLLLKVQRDAK